jgi:replication initiation protein RepC
VPRKPVATFPLAVVLDACPAIGEWTSEPIRNWKDFIRAASVARSALGISTSAWEDAIATMGAAEAAVTVAAILQKANAITAPGGYLRALTEKARVGRFSLGPILMALLRARLPVKRAATG